MAGKWKSRVRTQVGPHGGNLVFGRGSNGIEWISDLFPLSGCMTTLKNVKKDMVIGLIDTKFYLPPLLRKRKIFLLYEIFHEKYYT